MNFPIYFIKVNRKENFIKQAQMCVRYSDA